MTLTMGWHEAAEGDSAIPPQDDLGHLLFARGYLLSSVPATKPAPHWRSHLVGHWHLNRDSRLAAAFRERDGRSVLLIGNVIDLRGQVSGAAVADGLLDAWETSRAQLDDALEWLAGRYVVLGQSADEEFLQTDATGMLSASYSAGERMISSHQNLLAEAAGGLERSVFGESDWLRKRNAYAYPGTFTRFEGVRMLTANTELDLRSFTVRRVGPLESERRTPREVAAEVLDLMRRQHPFLSRSGGGPLVSLTAGLDSRITTAAMRELAPSSLFFTYEKVYDRKSGSDLDRATATELARHLGLQHHGYRLTTASRLPEVEAVLERTTFLTHGRIVAASYLRELPPDRLHVRSNLYEIARGYYRSKDRPVVDARLFARILTSNSAPPRAVIEAFDEMATTTGIFDVNGYDSLDLFYWEHRIVSWFHKVLLESDIAHDTHTLVNSRVILRLMLSVSAAERLEGAVFDHIVALAWPEAYDLPVNGKVRSLPEAR